MVQPREGLDKQRRAADAAVSFPPPGCRASHAPPPS